MTPISASGWSNLRRCSPFLIFLTLLCSCAVWPEPRSENYTIRKIGHQSKTYYASLAEGCDVFLKLQPLEPNALYVCDSTNLATAVLPAIITNLHPTMVVYTCQGVSIFLNDDCSIDWNRGHINTNIWIMTVRHHGKERTVYEEPSTKYCLAAFGLCENDADDVIRTNRVPHRAGLEYAWKLTIYSRDDQVRIKDIFTLPARGVWDEAVSVPEGGSVTVASHHISADGKECTTEYDLKIRKGSPETEIIQPYKVDKDDPVGIYRISLFLNGQPINKFTFRVVPTD
jgi:hypothetical protein